MIETSLLLGYFTPLIFISMAAAMVVLRAGASRIFFDIVGTMQVNKLIQDTKASATIIEALYLDALIGVQEGVMELGEGFASLMDDVIPLGREIGEAQRQFEKFVSTGEDLTVLNAEIIDLGHGFGFAADESFEAAAKMAQLAGVLGQGSTATGTEMGMAFGLISGMDTESAMQRMVNLNQQTGFMTKGIDENSTAAQRNNAIRENTMRILDQLNTVENTSAATMSQITFVMNQFASQAHLTGESLAGMAAMSAVLIEAGEEQGKGGRAIRTVYARLGADTNGARREIEKLGIAVIDQETGAMRPLTEILQDVSVKYKGMSGEQKSNLAQTVAGNLHYTRLIKLLEGTARMQELQGDALEGTFPAYEEIARLQDTNLFQLEQQEAKLKSVKGALGNELMPAMTDSIKLQIVFNDGLRQMVQSSPTVIGGFFKMAEVMRTMIGPFIQQILSVVNLRIAIETLNHVKRAMAGEDMFRLGQTQMEITQKDMLTTKLINHGMVIDNMIIKYGQESAVVAMHIAKYNNKAAAVGAVSFQQQKLNQVTAFANAQANMLSMGLMAGGTAMMMFSSSQKKMRTGMMLNTFAMMIQIGKMMASTVATTLDSIAKIQNTGVTFAQSKAAIFSSIANAKAGASAYFAAGGFRAMLTAAGPIGIVLVGIGLLANQLAKSFTDVGDGVGSINTHVSDLANTKDLLDTMTISEINAELEEQTRIVNDLTDAEHGLGKQLHDNAKARETELQDALDYNLLQQDTTREVLAEIEKHEEVISDFRDGFGVLFAGGIYENYKTGKSPLILTQIEKDNSEVFALLKQMGIDTVEELDTFLETAAKDTSEASVDMVNSITGALEESQEAMYQFNNSREELFYGFNSSNLTGDLIRQVQQQGVENLITNTELIVTNNFNGMTLPEMVDTITEEISSRLNLSISGN